MKTVARSFGVSWRSGLTAPVLRELAGAAAIVSSIGLFAIGISGLLAGAMGALWGKAFVSGDVSGVTYTPARCADYLSYFPNAGSCDAAAISHHFEEIVSYRIAAGVLGALALMVLLAIRRRTRRRGTDPRARRTVPPILVPSVGVALFGAATALLTLDGLNLWVQGTDHGAGGQLSGALVSAVLAVAFGIRLLAALGESAAKATPEQVGAIT